MIEKQAGRFYYAYILLFLLLSMNLIISYTARKINIFIQSAYYFEVIFPPYIINEVSTYWKFAEIIVILIIALLMVSQFRKISRARGQMRFRDTRIILLNYMINLIVYFIIFVVVLSALGINVYSLLPGSILIAALIALAGQSIIGNTLGGLMIEISRPFKPGDYVWIFPWSSSSALMGLQLSVLLQKYYSKDALYVQGVRGKVLGITINYTKIFSDGNEVINVPNLLVALGAFQLGPKSGSFSIRYEVPKHVTPDEVRKSVCEVTENAGVKRDGQKFLLDETTLDTYIVLLEFPDMRDQNLRTLIFDSLKARLEPMRIFPVKSQGSASY